MNAVEFGSFLEALANLLKSARANDEANALLELLPAFKAGSKSTTVKKVCDAMAGIEPGAKSGSGTVYTIVRLVPAIEQNLRLIAKKTIVDDFNLLGRTLGRFTALAAADLANQTAAILSPVKLPTYDLPAYLERLNRARGDETEFPKIYSALKADKSIKLKEAKQLARDFTGRSAKSKADAFDKIWDRHASLIASGELAKSTGGRTAA